MSVPGFRRIIGRIAVLIRPCTGCRIQDKAAASGGPGFTSFRHTRRGKTGENILTHTKRVGTTSMEHPEFFGYFVRNIYVKVFGYQSFSDLLPRLRAPHITGRYGEFSTKEAKNIHFCTLIFFENFTQQCHNFYGSFGKKKSRLQKKSKLSCT